MKANERESITVERRSKTDETMIEVASLSLICKKAVSGGRAVVERGLQGLQIQIECLIK